RIAERADHADGDPVRQFRTPHRIAGDSVRDIGPPSCQWLPAAAVTPAEPPAPGLDRPRTETWNQNNTDYAPPTRKRRRYNPGTNRAPRLPEQILPIRYRRMR